MKKFIILAFLLLFFCSYCPAQEIFSGEYLESLISESENLMDELQRDTLIKEILIYSIIFFGLSVSILQGINSKNKKWINTSLMIIGAVIAAITAINTKVIKYDINEVSMIKARIKQNIGKMKSVITLWEDEKNKTIVYGVITEKYKTICCLYDEYLDKKYGKQKDDYALLFFDKIYADSIPEWIVNEKLDVNYIYVYGKSESDNYDIALEKAESKGRELLYKKFFDSMSVSIKEEVRKDISKSLTEKAKVEDIYYEINSGLITVYVLLRIGKNNIDTAIKIYQNKKMEIEPKAITINRDLQMLK